MNILRLLVMILFAGFVCQAHAQVIPTINGKKVQKTDSASGSEMFSSYCAVCHGSAGRGNGPAASALKMEPADLAQLSKKNGGIFPFGRVSFTIEGREVLAAHGSRDMPIWGRIFQRWEDKGAASLRIFNLTEYVKTLQE